MVLRNYQAERRLHLGVQRAGTRHHLQGLPATGPGGARAGGGGPGPGKPAVGSETILLVEDEASVRSLVRGVLEARGYTVLEASRADEARYLPAAPGPIHLLLTDVVMPQTMGPALAENLAGLAPHDEGALYVGVHGPCGLR